MENNELDGYSMDVEKNEKEKLKSVFPECFVEGKLDINKLLNMCSEYITNDFEKYKFEWKGKSECFQIAQRHSTATLRPCKEESVNFDKTNNIYIEGDNLEVLKILQNSYYRKVKMIYIDPPYNTGNDFVYEDDFKDPIEHYKEVTSKATKSNPETMGRFHTAWLNMMYPRLRLAANLLRDDGVCFISIDDNEVHNLRKLCDKTFGEENFVAQINWKGRGGRQDSKYYAVIHEYILCYAKNLDNFVSGEEIKSGDVYPKFDEKKQCFYKTQLLRKWGSNSRRENRPNLFYPITAPDGSEVYPMLPENNEGCWRWGKTTMKEALQNGRVEFIKQSSGDWIPYEKIYEPSEGEEKTKKYVTWIDDVPNGTGEIKGLFGSAIFDYSKSINLIKKFIKMAKVEESDLILDFFSGSATTAHAVMQLNKEDGGNRKFIMVQLPESCDEKSEAFKAGYKNICEIGKERIRRAGKKLLEGSDQVKFGEEEKSLDVGFKVFKLDTSNLKTWDALYTDKDNLDTLVNRLNSMTDRAKPDRTDLDIVYEIILKLGLEMTEKIFKMDFDGKTAYSVRENCLFLVCLENNIKFETVKKMADLAPAQIVFGQDSFEDVSAVSNVKLLLRDLKIGLKFI